MKLYLFFLTLIFSMFSDILRTQNEEVKVSDVIQNHNKEQGLHSLFVGANEQYLYELLTYQPRTKFRYREKRQYLRAYDKGSMQLAFSAPIKDIRLPKEKQRSDNASWINGVSVGSNEINCLSFVKSNLALEFSSISFDNQLKETHAKVDLLKVPQKWLTTWDYAAANDNSGALAVSYIEKAREQSTLHLAAAFHGAKQVFEVGLRKEESSDSEDNNWEYKIIDFDSTRISIIAYKVSVSEKAKFSFVPLRKWSYKYITLDLTDGSIEENSIEVPEDGNVFDVQIQKSNGEIFLYGIYSSIKNGQGIDGIFSYPIDVNGKSLGILKELELSDSEVDELKMIGESLYEQKDRSSGDQKKVEYHLKFVKGDPNHPFLCITQGSKEIKGATLRGVSSFVPGTECQKLIFINCSSQMEVKRINTLAVRDYDFLRNPANVEIIEAKGRYIVVFRDLLQHEGDGSSIRLFGKIPIDKRFDYVSIHQKSGEMLLHVIEVESLLDPKHTKMDKRQYLFADGNSFYVHTYLPYYNPKRLLFLLVPIPGMMWAVVPGGCERGQIIRVTP